MTGRLYYGDNLDARRGRTADESIDPIYLDENWKGMPPRT